MINQHTSGDLFAIENLLYKNSNFSYGILIRKNKNIKGTRNHSWKALLDGELVDVYVDSIYFHQLKSLIVK